MKFQSLKERKKQKEKASRVYHIPKPEELNVWLPNMSDDQYFRLPEYFYSSSGILAALRQDDKSKEIFEYVRKNTPALQIGTLVHAHLLTPEIIPDLSGMIKECMERFPAVEPPEHSPTPEGFTRRVKRKPSALERVDGAVDMALSSPEIVELLDGSLREYAGLVTDYHGLSFRIKADAIKPSTGEIIDVKTSSKTLKVFEREVLSENPGIPYRAQSALYVDIANRLNELCGDPVRYTSFKWIYVRSKAPYQTGIVECPPEVLDIGRQEVKWFIEKTLKEIQNG